MLTFAALTKVYKKSILPSNIQSKSVITVTVTKNHSYSSFALNFLCYKKQISIVQWSLVFLNFTTCTRKTHLKRISYLLNQTTLFLINLFVCLTCWNVLLTNLWMSEVLPTRLSPATTTVHWVSLANFMFVILTFIFTKCLFLNLTKQ